MTLAFLQVDARGAPAARSPLADRAAAAGARHEPRGAWEVAASFGDPAAEAAACESAVGFADVSHLGKLELQGALPPVEPGTATLLEDGWWCPLTATRALVVCEPEATAGLHDRLAAKTAGVVLDVTTCFGALALVGPLAREAIARFCSLDLRERCTPVGDVRPGSLARTPGLVLREAADRYLLVFGAAYGSYMWDVVAAATGELGGRPVGLDALARRAQAAREADAGA
jgi:heterotetrameric sarcosine oxidase gamma subunit